MESNTSGKEKPQGSVVKHYCKVCHRGFGCAGALGGHMRAHVMGDFTNHSEYSQNFKIRTEDDDNNNNKQHSYFLRAKTPRFVGYHDLEDGNHKQPTFRKNPIEAPLMMSPPRSKSETYSAASSEEEDLANCLVMLSNKSYVLPNTSAMVENKENESEKLGNQFQCKACKKVFNSHQALGGHRASHKKVKGCFAAKGDGEDTVPDEDSIQEEEDHESVIPSLDRSKMHECSVCRRVFSSGQALGGHKRCHWLTTSSDNAFISSFQYDHQLYKKPMSTRSDHNEEHHQLDLNLNLPTAASQLEILNHINTTTTTTTTSLYLQQWANHNQMLKSTDNNHDLRNSEKTRDEMIKLKNSLCDLKDVNLDGGWLQMGIASTTHDIY